MRNLKKFLAVVVAIAVMMTAMLPAFAADTATAIPADAKVLADLNILQGSGSGVTTEYLAGKVDRMQAARLFLRLKGLEEEALKTAVDAANFSDASTTNDDGKKIMAYLKANPGLGFGGYASGKFGPADQINAQQYYKVLLTALGFKQDVDFKYSETLTFAETKGLKKVAADTDFDRADFAVASVEALIAKGSDGKTLAEVLVAAGKLDAAKAAAAGVYTAPVPAALDFTLSATNLKEVVITFNKAVDAATATTTAKYTVTSNTVSAAAISADNKVVTLTLGTNINQQGSIEVKVSKDLGLAADTTKKVEGVLDTTLPVAQSVKLTGPNTFDVTFSEPMQATGTANVLVNNGIYGVSNKVLSTDARTLSVTLSASTLADGTYTVKVGGYADFATFAALEKSFDLVYAKDTSVPTVKLVSATQTEVKVEFSKAVYKKGTTNPLDVNYFYHTYTAWKPITATASADGKTYTLSFNDGVAGATDYYLPEGSVAVTVLSSVSDVAVADAWGNLMAADAKLAATVTIDKTAPTVTKVEATAENTVVVTYSEDIVTGSAVYAIKDSAGKAVTPTISSQSYDADKKAVTLNLSAKLDGGNYSIEIKDAVDKALSANKITTVTMTFAITDKTAPTAPAAVYIDNTGAADLIYVTYNEAIATSGAGSALDINNYRLNSYALPADAKIELFGSDNKKVKITIADAANYAGTSTPVVIPGTFTIGRIADAAGNQIAAFATNATYSADTAPVVTAIKTINKNTIEVTFDRILSTVTADGIVVAKVSTPSTVYGTLASVSKVDKDGKTIVTGTLQAQVNLNNSSDVTSILVVTAANKLQSETGKYADAWSWTSATTSAGAVTYTGYTTPVAITDGFAPSFNADATTTTNASITNGSIALVFDEAVTTGAVSAALASQDLEVTYDGTVLTAGIDYTTSFASGNLVVTFNKSDAVAGKKVVIKTKSTVNYIKDAAGNKVNAFTKEITSL